MMMNSAPSFCRRLAVLCLWLSLLALAPVAPAAINITYYVSDFGLNSNSVRRVTITPISKAGDYSGSYLAPTAMLPDSFTNGTAIFSNKVAGYAYMLSLETTFSTTRRTNMFPSALSGNVNGYNYGALLTGFAADGSVLSWAYYYTTNVTYLIAGSGVTITTNGSAYTIASTGGGGGGVVAASSSVGITTNSSVYTPFVTGTLTNATTGNAATATLATNLVAGANITNATLSSIDNGILWTNYADAVGAQYDSEAAGLVFSTDLYSDNFHGGGYGLYGVASGITNLLASGTSVGWNKGTTGRATASFSNFSLDNAGLLYAGGLATDDSTSLTNVPTKWFSSISAMTNVTGVANQVVYVDSYFGSNVWGGGKFKWENTSATIDNGTVFASAVGGRWRRIDTGYPTNFVFMEWFGVVPNAAINQYTAAQAAINATATSEGKLILPPYNFAVGGTLTWTNRRGCFFGTLDAGYVATPGYRVYPNPSCVIHWMGANGGTNLVAYDVGHNTFKGFGLDTRIGLNNGDQYTNAAGLLMDVDMNSTHSTTTTANVFDGLYFRERHTNSALVGLRFASFNWQNCEFFQFANCTWQGGGFDVPEYWISVTNAGAFKAIQLGGNGGGANSFGHVMRNCSFDRWQYFIYSGGGSWDIENNYGTAAGEAAYYIDGVKASYIRGVEDEGDRRFLISPSVHGVTLENNRIAQSQSLSISNIAEVDGINLTLRNNTWNTDSSNLTPAVTNSFNSTGRYHGVHNKFPSTNDALLPSWRFQSSFKSFGDFGTITANNNIQSGPWKIPSPTQTTNIVYQNFTDGTASTMALTMMPSNGVFGVGSYINNTHFGVYNPDLNKTSMQFGDSVINPRFKLLPSSSGLISELQLLGSNSVFLEFYSGSGSTATRLDIVGASAVNKIHARTGSLKITGTNDTDLLTFGTDYKIKFPYDTNFEVVGPIHGNIIRVTNHITWFTNDAFASLSATPTRYGQISVVNSGATLYQVTATTNGTLAWASTNQIGSGSGSSATYGFGTNTAAASSWTNSANHVWSGNNTFTSTLIAGSLQSTLDGSATIWDHTSFAGASAGQELFDAFAIAGNKVFGIQSQPNDVQQPTNIFFRVDYPTKQKYGLGSFATNYIANANTAGYTNSRAAPGIGGTNNMVARVVGTSGTLEFYNRSGEYGVTVCGVGVFTNTISSSTWHIPIPVNSGFIIRSGVGVDIQVYAQ